MATRIWGKLFSVQRAIGWLDGSRIRNPTSQGMWDPQAQRKESGCQCSDWGRDLNSKGWYAAGEQSNERGNRAWAGLLLLLPSSTSSNLSRAFNSEKWVMG